MTPTNPHNPTNPANPTNSDEKTHAEIENDPLLSLRGSGRKIWADEHADDYVRRLREDWD